MAGLLFLRNRASNDLADLPSFERFQRKIVKVVDLIE
jgi:hypothetical protein